MIIGIIFYIDEPEISLSPSIQKNLVQLLAQKAANKQIMINTHCPHMIRWKDILAGAKVCRTKKTNNGKCEIKKLDSDSESFKIIVSGEDDWQKPHMLDAVAKEIFFSEKALFLEGQEDVGLIKKFINDNDILINFDIFGYGCGGSDKIPAFFAISQNLGIKAAALFDLDSQGIIEAQEYEKNSTKQFKVSVHPYEDIRVKTKEKDRKEKTGLFEANGEITDEKAKELRKYIENFKDFFNS